jgi:16S rRNA (guanine527-N7)-methyltransferase
MQEIKFFIDDLKSLQLTLDDKQLEQFHQYFHLLAKANLSLNLTTITEKEDVFKKHFIDSLSLVNYVEFRELIIVADNHPDKAKLHLIDIGTGAGFPGIPLKLAFPQLKVTLLDSLGKRIDFLDKVIMNLGLSDIIAIHGRAEDFAHQTGYREQYDLCVSRAVANLSSLSEYCLPFVKPGGLFIAYKSDNFSEFAAAGNCISLLGGQFDKHISFTLPHSDISRTLYGIRKITQTLAKYPRRAGMPTKKPL